MSTNQQRPWSPAFTVDGEQNAPILLEQVSTNRFRFRGVLRYEGDQGLDGLDHISQEDKEKARTLDGAELGKTDLATIPRFMRWFEGPYGAHTPAALIHDHLIVGGHPNQGTLGSDTASDRYFRFMLAGVGVPFLKRWLMWAGVALRTRTVVRGPRRISVVVWGALSLLGITAFIASILALSQGTDSLLGVSTWLILAVSLVAPFLAAFLWGRQYGAGMVGAVAAPWVVPAVAAVLVGSLVYNMLEGIAESLGRE